MPRYWPLLAVAIVPQVGNLVGIRIPGMFFVAIAVIGIWCAYNRDIPGTAVVAVGIGLNLLVMGFHGGSMPIRADILLRVIGLGCCAWNGIGRLEGCCDRHLRAVAAIGLDHSGAREPKRSSSAQVI